MLTKKQFKIRMDEFKIIKEELDDVADRIYNSNLNESSYTHPLGATQYEALFLNLMSDAMGLNDPDADDNWIWWWIGDTNFGNTDNIIKINGRKLKIDSLKKLYNLITEK